MLPIPASELLKDSDVVNEINRHKWFASEKAGSDIGFDKATREWIDVHSKKYLAARPVKSVGLWIKAQPFYNILNKEIKI